MVPIFNDGDLAPAFVREFARVLRAYVGHERLGEEVELLFINDGSSDGSAAVLRELCEQHDFVRFFDLSRNFGQHVAVSCGYRESRGRTIGMLNVDMEDPPDQIPLLLDRMNQGDVDMVLGCYAKRQVPRAQRWTSAGFNLLLNWLTGHTVPSNVATLRVMNRRFIDAYNALTEKSRYLPGLESWLGFHRAYVTIRHQPRSAGRSSYNFSGRLAMAWESILTFSDLPLKLAVAAGASIALVSFLFALLLLVRRILFADMLPGYTSSVVAIIFMGGLQILFTGFASLYIGRIHREVLNRPVFVVREAFPPPRAPDRAP